MLLHLVRLPTPVAIIYIKLFPPSVSVCKLFTHLHYWWYELHLNILCIVRHIACVCHIFYSVAVLYCILIIIIPIFLLALKKRKKERKKERPTSNDAFYVFFQVICHDMLLTTMEQSYYLCSFATEWDLDLCVDEALVLLTSYVTVLRGQRVCRWGTSRGRSWH